ncbi:MAG: alpha/beta fold hydrolase [Alphaproteobacteria bacterium]|nr:MAG: alpha/beta fold hydrolase [Alphaproteobacteria bacterium]
MCWRVMLPDYKRGKSMQDSPILALSGWAQPYDALHYVAPHATHLDYASLGSADAVFDELERHAQTRIAVGWSLGGTLLLHAYAQGRLPACQHMVILCSPVQFVRCAQFPHAMPHDVFSLFDENFRTQPLKTARRFSHLIAKEDVHYDRILDALPSEYHPATLHTWQWGLDWLAKLRHDDLAHVTLPRLTLIYGARDHIVHPHQGLVFAEQGHDVTYHCFEGCAHAPHIHNPAWIRNHIDSLMQELQYG